MPLLDGRIESELWTNFSRIAGAIPAGTTVTVDVTHGFRSLPLFAVQVLDYLGALTNVRLERMLYGAFEARPAPDADVPVFDLTPLAELTRWTAALDELRRWGSPAAFVEVLDSLPPARGRTLSPLRDSLDAVSRQMELARVPAIGRACREAVERIGDAVHLASSAAEVAAPLVPVLEEISRLVEGLALPQSPTSADFLRLSLALVDHYRSHERWLPYAGLLREASLTALLACAEPAVEGNIASRKVREPVDRTVGRLVHALERKALPPSKGSDLLRRFLKASSRVGVLRNSLLHGGHSGDAGLAPEQVAAHLDAVRAELDALRSEAGFPGLLAELEALYAALDSGPAKPKPAPVPTLFVRCGDRFESPEPAWTVLTLPASLRPEHVPDAVRQVRAALHGKPRLRLVIAGPVALGIALGQALEHVPTAIEYLQLNQETKAFEVWGSNRANV